MIALLIYIIVFALIAGLAWWVISVVPLPEPFRTVLLVVVVAIFVIAVIVLLLQLVPAGGGMHLGTLH